MEQQYNTRFYSEIQPPEVHQIWQCLHQIADPELPALSITDLGMIRAVTPLQNGWRVTFTPTYSGCPATEYLIETIQKILAQAGFSPIHIEVSLHPAWTTDWINANAKQRLRASGIAPPQGLVCEKTADMKPITCPYCGSHATEKISEFGSTACKALYRCRDCWEPFDYFKCI
ncbi:1,2-phenylacetyl-CoA epoxidase subunit PaaD [Xenorhabdus sp. TH1]|uniref:1,2-phenylacetyl-CoA epoxidase subunit PaaD n=1 Tax=Xenorhabdus sp. TH1 TaxID=3130166 RepID=UPI0030CD7076